MPPKATRHIQTRRRDQVRIGPVSIITLIIVICLAVMTVLTVTTSYATLSISTRQADTTRYLYANERAGQEFVAGVDEVLAGVRSSGGTARAGSQAVESSLDAICEAAREAGGSEVTCTASIDGTTVTADFNCAQTRMLSVAITIQGDASYRIEQWKMTSAQQDEDSTDVLWAG